MQRPPFTLEECNIKNKQYFQTKQQALALILSQFSIFIEEARYEKSIPSNFSKKFEIKKKFLAEKNREFINLLDQLYFAMQSKLPTIDKPSTAVLNSLNKQILNKKISKTVNREQQYNEYADIYILLKMVFNKLNELHQTCIRHLYQLEIRFQEGQSSSNQIPAHPITNSTRIEENDDINDQSITNLLTDETWLNVLQFLDKDAVENLGKTSRRFLNLTRDKQRYKLFPVATDFTEPKTIVSCNITGRVRPAFSPNRKWLAILKRNPNYLCIYAATGSLLHNIPIPKICYYLDFSHNSEKLVIGYFQNDTPVRKVYDVFDTRNWTRINTFSSQKKDFFGSTCVNNTDLFVLYPSPTKADKKNCELISYNLITGKEKILYGLVNLKETYVDKLIASTDQTQLLGIASGAYRTAIHVMSTTGAFPCKTLPLAHWLPERNTPTQLMPDSKKLLFITTMDLSELSEYDPSTNTYSSLIKFKSCKVFRFNISHDCRYFVAIMQHNKEGHKVELYHLKKRTLLGYFICPNQGVVNDIYIDHTNTRVVIVLEKELLIYTFDSIQPNFDKLRKKHEETLINGKEQEESMSITSCLTI